QQIRTAGGGVLAAGLQHSAQPVEPGGGRRCRKSYRRSVGGGRRLMPSQTLVGKADSVMPLRQPEAVGQLRSAPICRLRALPFIGALVGTGELLKQFGCFTRQGDMSLKGSSRSNGVSDSLMQQARTERIGLPGLLRKPHRDGKRNIRKRLV